MLMNLVLPPPRTLSLHYAIASLNLKDAQNSAFFVATHSSLPSGLPPQLRVQIVLVLELHTASDCLVCS